MGVAERHHQAERREWTGERGALTFVRFGEGVGLIVLDGKLDDDAVEAWGEGIPWLAGGHAKLTLFIDGAAVTFPNARFISAATSSLNDIRSQLERVPVLVSGPLLEMLAKTANLTLGGILDITRDRAQFEDSLERALA